jgi:hypothetical protein
LDLVPCLVGRPDFLVAGVDRGEHRGDVPGCQFRELDLPKVRGKVHAYLGFVACLAFGG